MKDIPAFSRPVEIAKVDAGGRVERIEATGQERAAIAAALGLVAIEALAGELTLVRDRADVIRVDGHVTADIVQSCVVSLVPVVQKIDEPISLRFVEDGSVVTPAAAKPAAEVRVDPGSEDPPEILTGTTIDLGPILIEHFILAIDPYPRAPDAALPDNSAQDQPGESDSPFAVLAGLTRSGPKDR
jgi:uncharacterized metal-binding protein YceD (DUF177 family)